MTQVIVFSMIHASLRLRKILRPALLGLPLFAILACEPVQPLAVETPQFSGDSTTYSAYAGELYNVHYITLSTTASSLTTGQQAQATAMPRTVDGTEVPEAPVTWSISPTNVATISETGLITGGTTSGAATVSATADGVTRSMTITVIATASTPSQPVHMISISANAETIKVGEVTQVSGVVRDQYGQAIANVPITWSSSPTSVATTETLNSTAGSVTGRGVGTATIYAMADSVTRSITISVVDSSSTTTQTAPTTTTPSSTAPAEQPRVTVNTAYPSMARQVRVPAGADLQAALDAAQPGDELLLAPGATYEGNFVLPNKGSSSSWIVVRTDVSDATLGGAGTRMTPSRAANIRLAKILTPMNASAVATAPGAHHWRLTGLELGGTPSAQEVSGIVRFGTWDSWEPTVASMGHDLILDRSYVHGTPTQSIKRCLFLSSAAAAVVDSWLSECHSNNGDSQAILALGGAGPYAIDNNELSGGHEVIMFGGGDPVVPNLVASDVVITRNHITRPATDRGVWQVKNLLELKSAKRVLIQGNVIENNWADGQTGYAVLIKSVNQDGGCTQCGTQDVTLVGNVVKKSGSGISIAGDVQGPSLITSRITMQDNLIDSLNVGTFTADGVPLMLLEKATDVSISHLTATNAGGGGMNAILFDGAPTVRLAVSASVLQRNAYGIKGSGTSDGIGTLDVYAPGAYFVSNAIIGGNCGSYPATTICPSSMLTTFPLAGDGKLIGADLLRIANLTRGAVVAP
jgi:hypothetical protein